MKIRTLTGCVVAISLAAGSFAFAHSGATGIVKERMMAMKDLGASVKALTLLDWGAPEAARKEVETLAKRIEGHADEMVRLFPEGSNKHPSEALDTIWSDAAGFRRGVDNLKTAATDLNDGARKLTSSADVAPFIKQLGATCQQCHQDYRKKK